MGFRTLVKKFIPAKLFRKIEPYGHLFEAVLLNLLNGFPARGMKVIGVTGTNGKTSTCWLIHRMMVEAGYKTGLITTVGWGAGKNINPQIHHMTNVAIPEFVARLKELKNQGVEWLVLESTSHALAQNRIWGVNFSVAVMTNVTHEHLEYHGTFERYRNAKLKLFRLANRHKKGLRTGVINADDASAGLFAKAIARPLTYGLKAGELRATNVKMTPNGSTYDAKIQNSKFKIQTNLPSGFNVYNSLAAVGVGHVIGLSKEQIEQGIAALDSVEGRMTTIDEGQPFSVIADYAHTPDSFEKLFEEMRQTIAARTSHLDAAQGSSEERASRTDGTVSERQSVTDAAMRQEPAGAAGSAGRQGQAVRGSGKGKIIVMFGSAGRRDTAKRPMLGELAGKYCDEVILTEEDDRDEAGNQILADIAVGAEKAGKVRDKDLFLILDRPSAIKFALSRAQAGDMVLLLGKGHEKTIERDDREDPYDEITLAREALKNRR